MSNVSNSTPPRPTPPWALVVEITAVLAILLVVQLIGPGLGTVAACVVALVVLRQAGVPFAALGFTRSRLNGRTIAAGAALGALIAVAAWLAIVPAAEVVTGTSLDTSPLHEAVETTGGLAVMLLVSWTLAAFGEEFAFRIYPLGRIAGGSRALHAVVFCLSALAFAVGHSYQGPAGMVATGVIGVVLATAYLTSARNAWLVVIAHGTVDTIAFLLFRFGVNL